MDLVERALEAYPGPPEALGTPDYGTAGFRAEASLLASTVLRCGLLAAARARASGEAAGLMITASHNPPSDNGVKLVEPSGEMLGPEWERAAAELAAAPDAKAAAAVVRALLDAHPPLPPGGRGPRPRVVLGRDTRPSGVALAEAARMGAEAVGVPVLDAGVVTTPELHFAVAAANAFPNAAAHVPPAHLEAGGGGDGGAASAQHQQQQDAMEVPYFTQLAESYRILTAGAPPLHAAAAAAASGGAPSPAAAPPAASPAPTGFPLFVDCANGVGGLKLRDLKPRLSELGLELALANDGATPSPEAAAARLNLRCGADFVQKERALPEGMALMAPGEQGLRSDDDDDPRVRVPPGALCASLDGDADRVVFFFVDPSSSPSPAAPGGPNAPVPVVLLDGDRIIALCARYVQELLGAVASAGGMAATGAAAAGGADGGGGGGGGGMAPAAAPPPPPARPPSVGVVQTAYANGASTSYLRDALKLPVACTPTGVKHLHREAKAFDVGVYFEANGHGTVLLRAELRRALVERRLDDCVAVVQLLAVARVMNQHVGDAIGGLLLVDAVLRRRAQRLWREAQLEKAKEGAAAPAAAASAAAAALPSPAVAEWAALYADLPSRQLKVRVEDRSAIKTADAERVCTTPQGLQGAIDAAVARRGGAPARAFARPSGTEDAVRVYAEAPTQAAADALALDALRAVYDFGGGVGGRP